MNSGSGPLIIIENLNLQRKFHRFSMEYEKMVLLIRAVDDLLFYEKTAVLVTALESVSLV